MSFHLFPPLPRAQCPPVPLDHCLYSPLHHPLCVGRGVKTSAFLSWIYTVTTHGSRIPGISITEGLEILVPWPQQAFLACVVTASLSRTNIFCLSAFAHVFLSKQNEPTSSYHNSAQPSEENTKTPSPAPSHPRRFSSISRQNHFSPLCTAIPQRLFLRDLLASRLCLISLLNYILFKGSEHVSLTLNYFSKWFYL